MAADAYGALLVDLFARRRFGIELGLDRVAAVAGELGPLPPIIRVAGTNGKGSTSAFIGAAARASGIRVGRFTSPHLCRFAERFQVDGAEAEPEELVAAAKRVDAAGGQDLTFFEYATALALALFRRPAVELAILEVGLGGRLDATRAVPAEVVVVTGVALDHQAILGDSLEQIAFEKAGACEANRPAIIGSGGEPQARALLVREASRVGADPVVVVDQPFPAPLAARGDHQRANAAVALAAIEAATERGLVPRDPDAWMAAISRTVVPGRFEIVGERPRVIVDAAHNPNAALALATELERIAERPKVAVIGVSSDKNLAAVIEPIREVVDEVIVTRSTHTRAASLEELLAHAPLAHSADGVAEAMTRASELAGPGGLVVACGSMFVAGEARAWVTGEARDAVPATEK